MRETASKKELVRRSVRDEIIRGVYRQGEPISERIVAEKLQVSRIPVREALIQLERDGLVEIVQGRGAQVRKFNAGNIESLYQTREAIEGMAARLAAERMNKQQLKVFREKFEEAMSASYPKDTEAISRLGDDFHNAIIEGSRNSMIINISESIRDLVHMARQISYGFLSDGSIEDVTRQHHEILEAIAEAKPDLAERRMRKHISTWRDAVLSHLGGDVYHGNKRT